MSVKVAPNSRTVTLYYNFQLIELILGYWVINGTQLAPV
jgi:hypothetical protein